MKKWLEVKTQKDVIKSHAIFQSLLPSKIKFSKQGSSPIEKKKMHSDIVYTKRNIIPKYSFSSFKVLL